MFARAFAVGASPAMRTTIRRALSSSYPKHKLIQFPALSPTMETGTIHKWNVKEGDSFEEGDVLCEVETDKANVDFDTTDAGVVAKITVEAGVEIPVGKVMMVTVEDAADVAAFTDFVPPVDAPAAAAAATEAPPPPPPAPDKKEAAPPPPPPPLAEKKEVAPAAGAPPTPPPAVEVTSSSSPLVAGFVRSDADLPLIKGPLAILVDKKKAAYHLKYGATGF